MNRTLLATAILALALCGCTNSEKAKADAEKAKAEAEKAKAELELAKLKAAAGQQQGEPFPNKPNYQDPPGKPNRPADRSKEAIPGEGTQTKPDKEAIEGEWTVIWADYYAVPKKAEDLATMSVTIAGDKFTFWERGTLNIKATFTVDPAKNPKQIDFKREGKMELGIYGLDGDELVLCVDDTGKRRPDSFVGRDCAMFVLKRKNSTDKGTQTKSDKDAIQGTWIVVAGEDGGQPLPAIALPTMSYVFAGDKYTFREGTSITEASFSLDPAKQPKQINVKSKNGFTQLGIYELKGDELRICINDGRKRRPDSFATTVENGNETHVLKRKSEGWGGGARASSRQPPGRKSSGIASTWSTGPPSAARPTGSSSLGWGGRLE